VRPRAPQLGNRARGRLPGRLGAGARGPRVPRRALPLPGWASAEEVLVLHQRLAGSDGGAAERADLLGLVGLAEEAGRRVEAMSKGMQQRLGIAQSLVGSPQVLLLDEPTSALDPAGRRTVREVLEELRRRGVAVLLNTHLLSEVELVCDRVVIIDKGRVVTAGRPDELIAPRGIEIETARGVRTYTGARRDDVPGIVAGLVHEGERVYEVRILASTLEDVYLDAVGGREAERGKVPAA
jgi:ABC-2 type transport system ATP-binding protein